MDFCFIKKRRYTILKKRAEYEPILFGAQELCSSSVLYGLCTGLAIISFSHMNSILIIRST